ncbi:hypothetical protein PQX77_016899 [Marasmius sp. AFHP31]|nr:hypothetical protein PQX77_016899 [Marasmius sp. AFHP31]
MKKHKFPELVAKANDRWTLTYVKPSKAETDVPESTPELIDQRRRWLNGSFAASVYALVNFFNLYRSGHGIFHMFSSTFRPSKGNLIKVFVDDSVGALVAAMFSTYGIYLSASFLYRDPWHMFSSFIQYLLLTPSFTNVLNVYAFCKLHDLLRVQEDIDAAFEETVTRAVTKVVTKGTIEKPTIDDENKSFRTRLVALWMLTNATLSIAIANLNGSPSGDPKKD